MLNFCAHSSDLLLLLLQSAFSADSSKAQVSGTDYHNYLFQLLLVYLSKNRVLKNYVLF